MKVTEAVLDHAASILGRHRGRANALKGPDLERMLGYVPRSGQENNAAFARKVTHAMRMRRDPVCSTPHDGYWWAESQAEIEATKRHLLGRLRKQAATFREFRLCQWREPPEATADLFA